MSRDDRSISDGWGQYSHAMPEQCEDYEIDQHRLTFYAGCAFMFRQMSFAMRDKDVDRRLKKVLALHKEIDVFLEHEMMVRLSTEGNA
jgi:hypothetical protein